MSVKKIFLLLLVLSIALCMFSCSIYEDYRVKKSISENIGLTFEDALVVDSYEDSAWDGSAYYYMLKFYDNLEVESVDGWSTLPISDEARGFCESSFTYNGATVIAVSEVDEGYYYYRWDRKEGRVYFAVLDAEHKALYYFYANGQAVIFPRKQ